MSLVGGLSDSDLEFVLLVSTGSVNVKDIALVAVVSLIERSHKPYAWLDSNDATRPRYFFNVYPHMCHQSFLVRPV